MLVPLLREEYHSNKDPQIGRTAWRWCHTRGCNGDCKYHSKSCSLNRGIIWFMELHNMARKKSSAKSSNFSTEFIRCEITSADKDHFKTWCKQKDVVLDTLVIEILQSNHKISFSYSEHSDSFIVSLTGKQEDCDNSGKCFTSHAKDYITALWLACYKFHIIFKGQAWENVGDEDDIG